jgi:hypothetical protein
VIVQLHRAPLPLIGFAAVHYWFVVIDPSCKRPQRWEVWQTANAGGISTGHVHCDLKAPEDGVGGGPSRLIDEWRGAHAEALVSVLREPRRYPHHGRYVLWPGPNSNTYVAWVLKQAGIRRALCWRAHGARFRV